MTAISCYGIRYIFMKDLLVTNIFLLITLCNWKAQCPINTKIPYFQRGSGPKVPYLSIGL